MNQTSSKPGKTGDIVDLNELIGLIRAMVGEVHPHWKNLHFTPDTHLEQELGLDSMARMELRTRIEKSLGISIDDSAAVNAITPNQILRAINQNSEDKQSGEAYHRKTMSGNIPSSELLMGHFGADSNTDTTYNNRSHSPGEWLYAAYACVVFAILGSLIWLLVILTPVASWRRKIAHIGARLFFMCTFTPLQTTGHEHLDPKNPQILVANHASYLDGFIITAALDIPIHFIVKGELSRILPARLLLQRFGVEFVDRFNARNGASDISRIAEKSRNGQTIVFFPEGTFTRFPGLQPFRMGAFVTSARTGLPVIPIGIIGARDIVRGNDWFPYRGRITVTVRPPILPTGKGWQVALRLRDAARKEIAQHCGEPDLVEESGEN
jgi:1-acyl-sn-glycerol-3-phosphate acyltransferase